MTLATYASGLVVIALVVGAPAYAGLFTTRAFAPTWPTPLRALGATVVATATVVCTAQLLGTVGLFSRIPLALGSVLAALLIVVVTRRYAVAVDAPPDPAEPPSAAGWFGVAAGALVVARWGWTLRDAYRLGIVDVDSQGYHMPFAARFAQLHRTTSLHYIGAGDGAAYHPATSEMLHGIGIAAFRSDALSIVFNFAFLFVALLAAYCVGRRFRAGGLAVVGFAVIAAAPLVAKGYAGSADNDFFAIAFFLAAAAFLLHADAQHRTFAFWLTGLAGGLALGTKLTMVVPVAGLTLTVVWMARRDTRRLLGFLGTLTLAGSYWYIRNFVQVGNPVPSLHIGILPSPPMPLVDALGASVADHLTDTHFWRHVVPDALRRFFGVPWPVTLGAAAAALAAGAASFKTRFESDRRVFVGFMLTAAATLATYVITPTSAGGPRANPFLFVYNLRYALPALAICLVVVPPVLVRRYQAIAAGVGVALLVATAASDSALPVEVAALAALLFAAVTLALRLPRSVITVASAVIVVGVVVAGLPLTRRYETNRFSSVATPRLALFHWGRQAPPGGRVAIVGEPLQYAFYGPHLSTTVRYVSERRPSHAFGNYRTCQGWRTALRDGHYDYVVVEFPANRSYTNVVARWTATEASSRIVYRNAAGIVFKLNSAPDPATCPTS